MPATALGLLAGGVIAAGPAVAASLPGPARQYGASTQVGTCGETAAGRLEQCPRPLPAAKLPAGARNKALLASPVAPADLAQLVDTRTWTSGGGNTFPGADVPFGMVQWSPDTLPHRSDGGGYSYGDSTLDGYSLTHLSGPGCGAAGDVPILPMTGALPSGNPNGITTSFTNTGEVAQAGYYSAQSNMPLAITSEFTATPHSSMGQFTFPATTSADFLVKLMDSETADSASSAQVVGDNEVMGSETSGKFCGESNNGGQAQQYTVYFDITFSQPFTASQVITESGQTNPAAVFLTFDTTSNPVIDAKVGISYVSTANAKLNWQTENPGWDFGAVKSSAQSAWDSLLGKIQVSGGTYAQTQEFYSLLYKDFMQPNITSDVTGQYMGSDFQVHTVGSGQQNQYGIYSGWDIYHSLSELQAMLDPAAAGDQAQSLLNYYSQNSILQQWGYLDLDNYVMVGDPAQSIIADYYAFGARNFDTSEALADMLKQATTVNDVRPGEALEQQYSYLPEDGTYGCCNSHGQVPTLLEYDTQDLALASFAAALGDHKDAAMLRSRANNWENVFDAADGLLNPRDENGQFVPGVAPTTTSHYVEGSAEEYLWNVPNDYPALFSLLGGDSKVVPELLKYWSQPNGHGQYGQITNEFDLGEQYALDYAGDPAGTQQIVNDIRSNIYQPGPSGLPNNDDLGANSSSFVFEMLGLYPENSGSDTLLLDSPGFPHAAISLPNGKTISINAPGASPTEYYVDSLRIDGVPDQHLSVPFSALKNGASLDWTLGTTPTSWGSARVDAPPSYSSGIKPFVGYLPSGQVTVAPGSTATVKIAADDATGRPEEVRASLSAPAGVTVSPGSGMIHVPAGGTGYLTVTVQADSSTPQTFYSVPVTLSTAGGQSQSLTQTVLVAPPGSLISTFSNAGISSDNDVSAANFDNDGNSYSQTALAAAGMTAGQPFTAGGITYNWPLPSPGNPDNTMAAGQTVTVNAPAGTQQVGFLGSATSGPSQGLATLTYSDGSTAQYWLGLSDWTLNAGKAKPSFGNQVAASLPYRNCSSCASTNYQNTVTTYLFTTSLPVDPTKTLTSVTLPSSTNRGALHIFAIGTSTSPMSGTAITSLSAATASAGQQVTISGTGFGASQGSGYVAFSDFGANWGAPGNAATFTVDSWSDTQITFTVPTPSGSSNQYRVWPGTTASVTVVNGSGQASEAAALTITPTSSMSDYYDNTGISPDNDQACANLDGDGYSLSANALAAAGVSSGGSITSGGVTFTWPNVASCDPDNVVAAGQTILLPADAGAHTLGFLGTSVNGGSSGTVTINYTDGTSSTATLAFDDWAGSASSGENTAATIPYRNSRSGASQQISISVWEVSIPVDSSKTVASITLPDIAYPIGSGVTTMHIFGIGEA